MEEHRVEVSPRALARLGGALYLIIIVFGIFGELFVRGKLIVSGDPTATAEKILASERLWRFSVAAELFYLLCAVALAAIFYVLLRPVSRDLARLALLFNLVSIAVEASGRLYLISALAVLRGAETLTMFEPGQLHALAYLSLQAHGRGFSISLLFFGCVCLVLGYLLFRSGYFPKLLGVLMQIAGLGYLTDGFALILSPAFHALIFPASLLPAFVAELSFCLWLLVKGVNMEKWRPS
jgi:hypothetical protein